jgi:nicotinamide riboside kinase
MKIAFTGASSTGKTTLANLLMKKSEFVSTVPLFLTADARKILDEMGFRSMDQMSQAQTRAFQMRYYNIKKSIESCQNHFLTDRSFVDVAAYWIERDVSREDCGSDQLESECFAEAKKYDIHFYFPIGEIQFESDGYRSDNLEFHSRIDRRIQSYLNLWGIRFIQISSNSLDDRLERVMLFLRSGK